MKIKRFEQINEGFFEERNNFRAGDIVMYDGQIAKVRRNPSGPILSIRIYHPNTFDYTDDFVLPTLCKKFRE